MSDSKRILRGTARAVTGVLVIGVSVTAVALLSAFELPTIERTPPSVTVDTLQESTLDLVCAGSFTVLGADPNRPDVAIPLGAPTLKIVGEPTETGALTRSEGGEGAPAVISGAGAEPLGAAQIQAVEWGDSVRGVAASTCAEPLNEQWLVGGDTLAGVTTTLNLGNPGSVPATVQVSLYDEDGRVAAAQTAGVLVPPGTQQTVSLNGYAPDRARLAVRVVSTGAPVTASLGIVQALAIEPFAVASVTRQNDPSTTLVIPGVVNADRSSETGPNDVGDADQFQAVIRVLAPGDDTGTARIRALNADGRSIELGEIPLLGEAISELSVSKWPADANAVIIEADVPVVGGMLGSIETDDAHDYAWFGPASPLPARETVATPVVSGGRLVVVNPGEAEAVVEISGRESKIPAGGAVEVRAGEFLSSSLPVYAGVRYLEGDDIEGYPVLLPTARDGSLTVYTR